eukprot:TRINITY_DN16007_c0_g1_i1.p1 TRINITY_DN16007_c0_g1~~TRINITY_DN16007_c0_g1_i1.p1  ORF type:complete len:780 (+),score=298.10 TRINITY_DN16007_c0_g1_i1:86-2341(+)
MAPEEEVKVEVSTRCKLYRLQNNEWVPIGVGQAAVEFREDSLGGRLILVDESDPRTLLIGQQLDGAYTSNYHRQQDTLILFSNPSSQEEFGLSFETEDGCREVWERLMMALAATNPQREFECDDLDLPAAETANLVELLNTLDAILCDPRMVKVREGFMAQLVQETDGKTYIDELLGLFDKAEAEEDIESLYVIWKIFRSLFHLNGGNPGSDLMRELLSVRLLPRVIACFEYSPLRPGKRTEHRKFLSETSSFANPLDLSPLLVEQIRHLYNVQYLKETVLASLLDDGAAKALEEYLIVNRNEVLSKIISDDNHVNAMFETLLDVTAKLEDREALLLFVQDVIISSATLARTQRTVLIEYLVRKGLLKGLYPFISAPSAKARSAVADILWKLAKEDVNVIRFWCIGEQKEGCPLLRLLLNQLVTERNEGIQAQWQDILKLVMRTHLQSASDMLPGGQSPPDMPPGFINLLYEPLPPDVPATSKQPPLIKHLFQPVLYHPYICTDESQVPPAWKPVRADLALSHALLYAVLPMISCCVAGHTARMNNTLLDGGVPMKLMQLLAAGARPIPTHLVLAVISFLKSLIATGDEMMARHIVTSNLLDPIFDMLKKSKRYTLLNSSILSLLDYVWREQGGNKCKKIIKHIVPRYREVLESLSYCETGMSVIQMHDKLNEKAQQLRSGAAAGTTAEQTSGMKRALPTAMAGNPYVPKLSEDDNDDYFLVRSDDVEMGEQVHEEQHENARKRQKSEEAD